MGTCSRKTMLGIGVLAVVAVSALTLWAGHVKAQGRVNITIQGRSIPMTFRETISLHGSDKLEVYEDGNQDAYTLRDGRVVGYLRNRDLEEVVATPQKWNATQTEAIQSKAEELLIQTFEVDVSKYQLEDISYIDSYQEVALSYTRYVDGLKTNDGIYISLDRNGELSFFSAPRQGNFDTLAGKVSKDAVVAFVEQEMARREDVTSYDLEDMVIDIGTDGYVVNCYVSLNHGDSVSGEILEYVI